jgi:hypothetical protein
MLDVALNIILGVVALAGALLGWVLLSGWREKNQPLRPPKGTLRWRVEWVGLVALKFAGAFLVIVAGLIGSQR